MFVVHGLGKSKILVVGEIVVIRSTETANSILSQVFPYVPTGRVSKAGRQLLPWPRQLSQLGVARDTTSVGTRSRVLQRRHCGQVKYVRIAARTFRLLAYATPGQNLHAVAGTLGPDSHARSTLALVCPRPQTLCSLLLMAAAIRKSPN